MAIGSFYGGLKCYIRGKKLKALSARAAMAQDGRPPVLYLRSFVDDRATSVSPIAGLLGFAAVVFGISTEEEQLAEGLKDIGPCIAIGKPGEKLPELGAARMYVSDAEWQERVGELMTRAQLVVLRAGKTEGFWWEVKRAAEIVAPEKLVFLLPFGKRKYNKFRERADALLPQRLPAFPGGPSFSLGHLQAMLYFGSDWTPHISKLKARFSLSANPLVPMLKKALEPVAEHLHLESRKPPKQRLGYLSRALGTIPGVLLAMWGIAFVVMLLIATAKGAGLGVSSGVAAAKHNYLGLALYEKNDLDGAIAEYREALRLVPDLGNAHNNLGLALYAKHDLDGAISEYREALRLGPDSAQVHSNLSLVLYDKDDVDAGIAECRKALHLDPQNASAHNNLGLGLIRKRDPAAFDEFRKAFALAPNDLTIRANYEWALRQTTNR